MSAASSLALVTRVSDKAQASPVSETWGTIEPVFQLEGVTDLSVQCSGWRNEAGEFMSYRVSRSAGDLRNHVQRINLAISERDAETVYGALLDLFIVLGSSGGPLRQRLLDCARPLLNDERFEFLNTHLESGVDASDRAPASSASVLSRGLVGELPLVIRLDVEDPAPPAPDTTPQQQAPRSPIGRLKKWLNLN